METKIPPSDPTAIRRVAFLGTPALAVPTLVALHEAGYEVPLVVSGADKRRGRGREKSPTPVKAAAEELGIEVTTEVDDLLTLHKSEPIDLAVVVAFGKIIRSHVLAEIPMVNIHFSPLPRWRGAAPVERAILAGDTETAIAIMSVAEGLDEGDVWATKSVAITQRDTVMSLWESMSEQGPQLLVDTMRAGFTDPTPQVGEVVYAHKLTSEDRRLDWTLPAVQLARIVRVGGAWTTFRGERFKVHETSWLPLNPELSGVPGEVIGRNVAAVDGLLMMHVVQAAGKPRMDFTEWANGAQPDGDRFGSEDVDG